MTLRVEYTPLLERTRSSNFRTIVHIGGAGSSKSYSLVQLLIEKLVNEQDKKIGICRKTFPALRMTAMSLVIKLLKDYGIYDTESHNKTANTYQHGSNILQFFSLDDPEKIKSADFNYIWMEEANEFTYEDYTVLKLRLRHPTKVEPNQLFLSLNPIDEHGWIPTKLIHEEGVEVIHSTYEDNPFLSIEYINTLKNLINEDDNYYRVYTLGQWGRLDNLVYRNWKIVDNMPTERQAMAYGLDFGFVNPSALVRVTLSDNHIYLEEVLYRSKLTNADIIEVLSHQEKGDIYADPTELQMIEEIRQAGYNIYPAQKDVRMGINLCKRQALHVTKDSTNIIKEIQGYQHKQDHNGNVLEEPVKFRDHTCDAFRYAVYGITERYGFATADPMAGESPVWKY